MNSRSSLLPGAAAPTVPSASPRPETWKPELLALLGAFLWLFLATAPAFAVEPAVPALPPDHVVDLAGVIDGTSARRLSATLRELEQKTTAQVVVLTINSLEGESLEALSIDIAHNRWKLGQKGKDNGVLITVAVRDRRYRIEVGYGLEGILPDSLVGSIGRERLVPAFRRGDFGGGLVSAALAIAGQVAASAGVGIEGVPAGGYAPREVAAGRRGAPPSPLAIVLGVLVLVALVALFIKHPGLFLLLLLSSRGGGRGGWGGGGGFGGGGGGFGGGGSSGSW